MQNNDPVVIVGMARTPKGAIQGELAGFTATDLGKTVLAESLKRSGLAFTYIEDVIMGCVLPAGLGQAPARLAVIKAGLPDPTGISDDGEYAGVRLGHARRDAGAR